MSHKGDREVECLVAHGDQSKGGCWKCDLCGEWIRPHDWDKECPGKSTEPVVS